MGIKRDYNDPQYKAFRQAVRRRDKKCRWLGCGAKKKLQVHHILPWEDYPNLRYDVDNGITLCRTHHKLITGSEYTMAGHLQEILKNGL